MMHEIKDRNLGMVRSASAFRGGCLGWGWGCLDAFPSSTRVLPQPCNSQHCVPTLEESWFVFSFLTAECVYTDVCPL